MVIQLVRHRHPQPEREQSHAARVLRLDCIHERAAKDNDTIKKGLWRAWHVGDTHCKLTSTSSSTTRYSCQVPYPAHVEHWLRLTNCVCLAAGVPPCEFAKDPRAA